MTALPLLKVHNIAKSYGHRIGCARVSLDFWPRDGLRRVFMDEPTDGLDVSVQARPLDLVRELGLSAITVTHGLAVVRLLADRPKMMKEGHVVEEGLTDQALDDPQHGYTQLLVSSVFQV